MNKNGAWYYRSAKRWHLPVAPRPEIDGFELLLGGKRYFFRGALTPLNNGCGDSIASNKYCTNKVLEQAGIPVPKATAISATEFKEGCLPDIISGFHFPLVLKPLSKGKGQDVLCNIRTPEALAQYLPDYFDSYDFVCIEEFHDNLQSYRVLVLKNEVIGVVLRFPAKVVGDGVHTLQELIELENISRKNQSDTLGSIQVDNEVNIRLNELGLTLEYIPEQDETVTLCYTSNATRGGTYESLGVQICKENRELLVRAARELSLELVGFDVQCVDINIPIEQSAGVIIEANYTPSVRIHEEPIAGIRTPVSKKIIRALIYRHPLSYLYVLYQKASLTSYIRAIITLIFLRAVFKVFV